LGDGTDGGGRAVRGAVDSLRPEHGVPVLRDRGTGRDGDRLVPDLRRTRGAAVSTTPPTPDKTNSSSSSRLSSMRVRVGLFVGICVLAVGLGVAGVLIARRNHANAVDTADTVP